MMSLVYVFYLFVLLAAVIGAMRGWAKELLVAFSAILAIFIILVFEAYVGAYQGFVEQGGPLTRFWARTIILLLLAFFGYQTPRIKRFTTAARREKLQDSLLGAVLGGGNAYLVIGSVWAYLAQAGYHNFSGIEAPLAGTPLGDQAIRLLALMPPTYLDIPGIYFAIAIAFTFVVIVYV